MAGLKLKPSSPGVVKVFTPTAEAVVGFVPPVVKEKLLKSKLPMLHVLTTAVLKFRYVCQFVPVGQGESAKTAETASKLMTTTNRNFFI
jgi:hypothetical protein